MNRKDRIEAALRAAFAPQSLEIADDSAKHAGHAHRMTQPGHAGPEGETHYSVAMISAAFVGLNRVARQRAVNEALKAEFDSGLHALGLKLKAPGE
jgi:BolA family transcriptional regulator, general stress-responsive regulator